MSVFAHHRVAEVEHSVTREYKSATLLNLLFEILYHCWNDFGEVIRNLILHAFWVASNLNVMLKGFVNDFGPRVFVTSLDKDVQNAVTILAWLNAQFQSDFPASGIFVTR